MMAKEVHDNIGELLPIRQNQRKQLTRSRKDVPNAFLQDLKDHPIAVLSFLSFLLLIAFFAPMVAATARQRPPMIEDDIDTGFELEPYEEHKLTVPADFTLEVLQQVQPMTRPYDAAVEIFTLLAIAETGTVEQLQFLMGHLREPSQAFNIFDGGGYDGLARAARANNQAVFNALLGEASLAHLNRPFDDYASLLDYCVRHLKNPDYIGKIFEREKALMSLSAKNRLHKKDKNGNHLLWILTQQEDLDILSVFFQYTTMKDLHEPHQKQDTLLNAILELLKKSSVDYVQAFFDMVHRSANSAVSQHFLDQYEEIELVAQIAAFKDRLLKGEFELLSDIPFIMRLQKNREKVFRQEHGTEKVPPNLIRFNQQQLPQRIPSERWFLYNFSVTHPYEDYIQSVSHLSCKIALLLRTYGPQEKYVPMPPDDKKFSIYETLLQVAVEMDQFEIVAYLLQELGLDPNSQLPYRPAPLILSAALNKDRRILDLLVQHGADIFATDENGFTAGMYSCLRGGPYLHHSLKFSWMFQVFSMILAWSLILLVRGRAQFPFYRLSVAVGEMAPLTKMLWMVVLMLSRLSFYKNLYEITHHQNISTDFKAFVGTLMDDYYCWFDYLTVLLPGLYYFAQFFQEALSRKQVAAPRQEPRVRFFQSNEPSKTMGSELKALKKCVQQILKLKQELLDGIGEYLRMHPDSKHAISRQLRKHSKELVTMDICLTREKMSKRNLHGSTLAHYSRLTERLTYIKADLQKANAQPLAAPPATSTSSQRYRRR